MMTRGICETFGGAVEGNNILILARYFIMFSGEWIIGA
jgi:hypothetical protein